MADRPPSPAPPPTSSPGWPIPWPALLIGGLLIAGVVTNYEVAGLYGSIAMILASLIGAPLLMLPQGGEAAFSVVSIGLSLVIIAGLFTAAVRARSRGGRSVWLNLGVMAAAALVAAVLAFFIVNARY